MVEQLRFKEWRFPTVDVSEALPVPEQFTGNIPDNISMDDIGRVQREADETYEIVRFKGVEYEHVVFNPGADPANVIGFTPTIYSGARKNPGNMHEKAIDAIAMPDVQIDYLTPFYNHPAGSMRKADYKYVLATSRTTKGTGAEDDKFRPLDSMLDIVELYEKMGWTFPNLFSSDTTGGRQQLGRAAAFATARGMLLNGMPGIVEVEGYDRINIYADYANRLKRLGGSAASLEVNGKTQRAAKRNMPHVYPWHKYYAHQLPVPAFMHPVNFVRSIRLNEAYKRHANPNKPDHAVRWDLLAAMAINDAPVTITFGSDNPLGPSNEIRTFLDDFVRAFPDDIRSPARTITLKVIENQGVDHHTQNPPSRTAIEHRTFGFGAMLSLVHAADAIPKPTGTDG